MIDMIDIILISIISLWTILTVVQVIITFKHIKINSKVEKEENAMKKAIKKYTLRKLKTSIPIENLKDFSESEFIILYRDNKYEEVYNKDDLLARIETKGPDIWYIFDMIDRIILERHIIIRGEPTDYEDNRTIK